MRPGPTHNMSDGAPSVELDESVDNKILLAQIGRIQGNLVIALRNLQDSYHSYVRELVCLNCPLQCKYQILNLSQLLAENCQDHESLERIASALSILKKYAVNLLKPATQRPPGWRAVSFLNSIFKDKVDFLRGAGDILNKLGYTVRAVDGLSFPADGQPDVQQVAGISADLIVAQTELQMYQQGQHPHPHLLQQCLPPAAHRFPDDNRDASDWPMTALGATGEFDHYIAADRRPQTAAMVSSSPFTRPSGQFVQPLSGQVVAEKTLATSTTNTAGVDIKTSTAATEDCLCDICGQTVPSVRCSQCDNKQLCDDCDQSWHGHPKRRQHRREPYSTDSVSQLASCDICGECQAQFECRVCDGKQLCVDCDAKWHKHPARRSHSRTLVDSSLNKAPTTREPVDVSLPTSPTAIMVIPGKSLSVRPQAPKVLPKPNRKSLLERYNPETETSTICSTVESELSIVKAARTRSSGSTSAIDNLPQLSIFNCSSSSSSIKTEQLGTSVITSSPAEDPPQQQQGQSPLSSPLRTALQKIEPLSERVAKSQQVLEGFSGKIQEAEQRLQRLRATSPTAVREIGQVRTEIQGYQQEHSIIADYLQQLMAENRQPPAAAAALPLKLTASAAAPTAPTPPRKPATSADSSLDMSMVSGPPGDTYLPREPSDSSRIHREPKTRPYPAAAPVQQVQPSQSQGAAALDPPVSTTVPEYRSRFVDVHEEKLAAQAEFQRRQEAITCATTEALNEQLGKQPADSQAGDGPNLQMPAVSTVNGFASDHSNNLRSLESTSSTSSGATSLEANGGTNLGTRLEKLAERKKSEELSRKGRELVRSLRAAETKDYSVDEYEIALVLEPTCDPLKVIEGKLATQIKQVVQAAEELSIQHRQVTTHFSKEEAITALSKFTDDFQQAVQFCVDRRQKQVESLRQERGVPDEEIQDTLYRCHGDEVEARKMLEKISSEEFLARIWEGADQVQQPNYENLLCSSVAHSRFQMIIQDPSVDYERRLRMVLVEGGLEGWERAKNVLRLLEEEADNSDVDVVDVIEAVRNCGNIQRSRSFLQQECEVCFCPFPATKIQALVLCQCRVCKDCMSSYFAEQIRSRHIKNLVCPVCQQPDIDDPEKTEPHFEFLHLMLNALLADDVYRLFQDKLRDWHLMKDPNFRWCSYEDCECGFIFNIPEGEEQRLNMRCPSCERFTCFKCKKPWQIQHEGLTCQQFQDWQEANDPERQAAGLARHLQENGIDCPRCKYRYALAKGGCIHFKCTQCGHEFCSGCYQPFKKGETCRQLATCAKAGLHCHHPRDCLYYLRDNSVGQLQKLLKDKKVDYNTEVSQEAPAQDTCPVLEQKEVPEGGMKDEACGRQVLAHHAGLCATHYKEYLVELINKHGIDPVVIMNLEELKIQLKRLDKAVPAQQSGQNDKQYRASLIQHIKTEIPLSVKRARSIDVVATV